MKNILASRRLYIEILATVFLTEAGVMYCLPLFQALDSNVKNFFDAFVVALIAGPVILWRCNAADKRSFESTDFPTASRRNCAILIGGVLVGGLGLTILGVQTIRKHILDENQTRLSHAADLLVVEAERSFSRSVYGIKGLRGFYQASKSVERSEFRAWVDSRNFSTEFNGVTGFGFIKRVMQPDLEKFIAAEKADDAPDFAVQSLSPNPEHYILKYIEPLAENRSLWGEDVGSNPILRSEIETAIRTGELRLTTKISVIDKNQQKDGLAFLLAVYRNGTNPTTPEERIAALDGILYAPVIIEKTFDSLKTACNGQIDYNVFLGTEYKAAALVLDIDGCFARDQGADVSLAESGIHRENRIFQLGGRSWMLSIRPLESFDVLSSRYLVVFFGVAGVILTLLMTSLVMLMSGERARALMLAKRMTHDLEISKNEAVVAKDHAEAVLVEKEALVNALNLHAIVSFTDVAGNITFANDTFLKISGYTREELMGKNHQILKSGIQEEGFWPSVWKQISSGTPAQAEVCNKAKDGSFYWVRATICPLKNSVGKIEKYISIRTDITAIKEIEIRLKTLVSDLQQQTEIAQKLAVKANAANIAKREFLANVSHEIRTPVNGVIGMTELLLRSGLDDDQRRLANTVKRSGEILLTLINNILDFSKIEAGKMGLEETDFDLNLLIDDFSEVMGIRAQEKSLDWVCWIEPNVPVFLRGDAGRLRQILTNLVGNAIKFSDQGLVSLRISVETELSDEIVLRFSVKDTGVGISEDKFDRLFQNFSQVDGSKSRNREGTGLGLAISKQLVELMHGDIGVTSVEGKGSEFWFTVRLKRQARQEESLALSDIAGKSVLIIDHHPLNRQVLHAQLEFLGMMVEEATSAPEALRALSQAHFKGKPFDVTLLDTNLLGSELLVRSIREDKSLSKVSIILMMTVTSQVRGEVRRFETMGFAALLTRPVRKVDLLKCVTEALAPSGAGTATVNGKRNFKTSLLVRDVEKDEKGDGTGTASSKRLRVEHAERILVAEDNGINQQVALGMLKTLGYTADIASNGKEAIAALEKTEYALVLMDMMMPEMDGLEATGIIRSEKSSVRNHQIPVIAMTANIAAEDRQTCMDVGMDDYLSKPISIDRLEAMLAKWLISVKEEPLPVVSKNELSASQIRAAVGSVPLVFNQDELLKNLNGDTELAHVMAKMFLDDIQVQIARLAEMLEKRDTRQCQIQAHSIKGAAMTMGCEVLQGVAYELEKAAQEENLEFFATRFPELSVQFEAVKKTLKTFAAS